MPGARDDAFWADVPPPHRGLRFVVVVPLRNEAAHVVAALQALAAQTRPGGGRFERSAFEILVLANNCDDASASLAREFARSDPDLQLHVAEVHLPPAQANIGYVRRCLMDEAWRRLGQGGAPDGTIVSTDGDTRVAGDWLARIEAEIVAGADAVGGRIFTDAAAPPPAAALRMQRLDAAHSMLRSRLASLLDPEPADPWPRHHQHFGASLAVTARAYARAGGVPEVPYLEDEALVLALRRTDARVRHSPAVRVVTSGRLDGRAEVGLSWQLRQWAEGVDPRARDPLVEDPELFARSLRMRAAMRRTWARSRGEGLVANAPTFFTAWEQVDSRWRQKAGSAANAVPMSRAVLELRDSIRSELAMRKQR